MKTKMTRTILTLAALLVSGQATFAQNGGHYTVDWFTIDGGGGTSTGGVYSVNGTIGQPDAGSLSGGQYSLNGGFWSVIAAVQTPDAPFLSIERLANGSVRVLWPIPAASFSLDQSMVVGAAASWLPVSPPYQTNTTHISITLPMPAGSRFYRLRHP
jgi:hypothetical protein